MEVGDNLPNPLATPHTWEMLNLLCSQNEQFEPLAIMAPGLCFIAEFSQKVFSLGKPGYLPDGLQSLRGKVLDPKAKSEALLSRALSPEVFAPTSLAENIVFDILHRGATGGHVLASILPMVGCYVLYLWLLRDYLEGDFSGFEIFTMSIYHPNDLGNLEAGGSSWWLHQFVSLAIVLEEYHLDLIPPFCTGSIDGTKKHPKWKNIRKGLEKCQGILPCFRLLESDDGYLILAGAEPNNLPFGLIAGLADNEFRLRQFLQQLDGLWAKTLRGRRPEIVDDITRRKMDLLRDNWPFAYMDDGDLQDTDAFIARGQNWRDPIAREDMESRTKAITNLYKQMCNFGPGNRYSVIKEIPGAHQDEIIKLMPDLRKVLELAWPIKEIRSQKQRLIGHNFDNLKAKHFEFPWHNEKLKKERLHFLASIVQKYLEDICHLKYNLASIKSILSSQIPK